MKTYAAKQIDINDWELSGGGAQGESYFNKANPDLMMKLFMENADIDSVAHEIELSIAIHKLGISCPAQGEFVRYGNRYGITFQRIKNKKSFCKAVGDDPSLYSVLAGRLANMARDLHSRSNNGTSFISLADFYGKLLQENNTMDEQMRKKMEECLEFARKEETNTLTHGDFHFGNVITDGKNDYFIDLGCFSYGNPNFDNSTLYFISRLCPEKYLYKEYHLHEKESHMFWEEYRKAYYGPDAPSTEELHKIYLPYLFLRTLFFESVMGYDDFVKYLRETWYAEMSQ